MIRFRHFEELHRRLKEYAQYNLHLPPKHFLSSGLEVPVVRERCKLLDIYLKVFLVLFYEASSFFSLHTSIKLAFEALAFVNNNSFIGPIKFES